MPHSTICRGHFCTSTDGFERFLARRRHHLSSRQFMDDADCTQRHRCGRWPSARQTAFDPRPRCEILRRIPHCSRARRCSRHSIAAAFAQFEFVRGKIRQIHKGRVPESVNLLWKGVASARDYTIPQPLQLCFILHHLAMLLIIQGHAVVRLAFAGRADARERAQGAPPWSEHRVARG